MESAERVKEAIQHQYNEKLKDPFSGESLPDPKTLKTGWLRDDLAIRTLPMMNLCHIYQYFEARLLPVGVMDFNE